MYGRYKKWRQLYGNEEYVVSINGEIKKIGGKRKTKKILKPTKIKNGYYVIRINGKTQYQHRLVALSFPEICGEYFEGAEVDHLDNDRENNSPFNLQFVTKEENRRREQIRLSNEYNNLPLF